MATTEKTGGGLEDVVATSSSICYLDGDCGVLAYCGYDIHDLAKSATYEEVCYLLWHRRLPTRAELGDLQSQLAAARPLPEALKSRVVYLMPDGTRMRHTELEFEEGFENQPMAMSSGDRGWQCHREGDLLDIDHLESGARHRHHYKCIPRSTA